MENSDLIQQLTLEDFTKHQHQVWQIVFDAALTPLETTLKEIRPHQKPLENHRQGFSLVFVTSQTKEYYRQGIYTVIHPDLGSLPLFMVPLGPGADGLMQYEIIIA